MEQRTRSADAVVVWILSVLLAAVFATTGISKLIGQEPIGLQAAAMHGFPTWIRMVVGVVEIAGLIGATAIAVWFFFVDLIAGHALFTPTTLGRGMLSIFGPVPAGTSNALFVVLYTFFHYAAFVVVGLIAAMIVYVANREPSI